MRFALVIPALNEQEAIASTLRRALAARAVVQAKTPVTRMDVVFVNDGSTDDTQAIVDQDEFAEVLKVRFERNRGYGAAIKAGFAASDAELVGFMDADGTCEPLFCVDLINALLCTNADVVLARRLEPNTQMPLVRKIGNRIFAMLLGVMSGHRNITDTASGFRVLRRSSLKLLSPLPDGLHYTPTMSAIGLLDPRLRIEEVGGMLYKEREGRSKLRVVKDGFRFLWTILFAACCYSPIKTMLGAAVFVGLLTLAAALGLATATSAAHAVLAALAGTLVMLVLVATGVTAHELNFLLIGPRRQVGPLERALQWLLNYRRLILGGLGLCVLSLAALAAALAWQTAIDPLLYAVLVFAAALGATACMGGIIVRVIWAVGEKQKAMLADEYQVREEATNRSRVVAEHSPTPMTYPTAAHP